MRDICSITDLLTLAADRQGTDEVEREEVVNRSAPASYWKERERAIDNRVSLNVKRYFDQNNSHRVFFSWKKLSLHEKIYIPSKRVRQIDRDSYQTITLSISLCALRLHIMYEIFFFPINLAYREFLLFFGRVYTFKMLFVIFSFASTTGSSFLSLGSPAFRMDNSKTKQG